MKRILVRRESEWNEREREKRQIRSILLSNESHLDEKKTFDTKELRTKREKQNVDATLTFHNEFYDLFHYTDLFWLPTKFLLIQITLKICWVNLVFNKVLSESLLGRDSIRIAEIKFKIMSTLPATVERNLDEFICMIWILITWLRKLKKKRNLIQTKMLVGPWLPNCETTGWTNSNGGTHAAELNKKTAHFKTFL